jgi:hypothetical protein
MDFYALREDIRSLFHIIFEETDLEVFESISDFDSDLRHFRTFQDLDSAFNLGTDAIGNASAPYLALWSPSVMPKPRPERFDQQPQTKHYRYSFHGSGMILLNLGGEHNGTITPSCYRHWNEAGARQNELHDVDAVNWGTLERISGRIQRHARRKMAVAKIRGYARVVLPQAFAAVQKGMSLSAEAEELRADAPQIQLLKSSFRS